MANTILIILILVIFVIIFVYFVTKTTKIKVSETQENPYSISYLTEYTNFAISTTLRQSMNDMNLNKEEFLRYEHMKRKLRQNVRNSAIGDITAKKQIKFYILNFICGNNNAYRINELNIDKVIPFEDTDRLSSQDKFEILAYIYANKVLREDNSYEPYGADGIKIMFKDNGFLEPNPGTNRYEVTSEDINRVYDEIAPGYPLSYQDKQEIIAQRIFENLYGFGAVDVLLDSSIDEVEGGVSGVPKGSYEFKSIKDTSNLTYSYESIWVVISGYTIHLKCLSFGSQDELIRICNNIYKYDAPNVMSRTMGKVVATMKDGARIVVARPPFADSYFFIARKFDSTPSISLENLLPDEGAWIVNTMAKWLIKGTQNIAITGDQGTGKTTMLKSFIEHIREDYSLRIQELTPELNLRYVYPNRNVVSFRETNTISSQEGLDLQKKTSGAVNIVGEVATAEAASWIIQTAKVASKMTMFTHHAKTTDDLIVSLRNNVMQVNNYTDDSAVDEMIASSINVDVHLARENGKRFISRITEIIPIRDREYPAEMSDEDIKDKSLEDLQKADVINANEYRRRRTDRILFKGEDLVVFNKRKNRYELKKLPSAAMMEDMTVDMTFDECDQMRAELKELEEKAKEKGMIYIEE